MYAFGGAYLLGLDGCIWFPEDYLDHCGVGLRGVQAQVSGYCGQFPGMGAGALAAAGIASQDAECFECGTGAGGRQSGVEDERSAGVDEGVDNFLGAEDRAALAG
jgi:hypothetical protein